MSTQKTKAFINIYTHGARKRVARKPIPRRVVHKQPGSINKLRFNFKFACVHNGSMVYACINIKPSQPELAIARILRRMGVNFIQEALIGKKTYRYDFFIPDRNLLLEYDSDYYHRLVYVALNDAKKTRYAKELGIRLIRLSDKDLPGMEAVLRSLLI